MSCNLQCQMSFPHSLTVMIQIYTLFYDNHDYFIIIVFNPPAESTCLTPVADQSHLWSINYTVPIVQCMCTNLPWKHLSFITCVVPEKFNIHFPYISTSMECNKKMFGLKPSPQPLCFIQYAYRYISFL